MPNRLHRYYGTGYSHFITTSCYQRLPLLGSSRNRDVFLRVLEQVRRRYGFVVAGYVVMPEHVGAGPTFRTEFSNGGCPPFSRFCESVGLLQVFLRNWYRIRMLTPTMRLRT